MGAFERPCRLTVCVCDNTRFQHKAVEHNALGDVIVHRAHEAGLSGATVLRGVEGFGRSGDVHTTRILDISDHLPVAVVIVDDKSKLRDIGRSNDDCMQGRLVTIETLKVCCPLGGERTTPTGGRRLTHCQLMVLGSNRLFSRNRTSAEATWPALRAEWGSCARALSRERRHDSKDGEERDQHVRDVSVEPAGLKLLGHRDDHESAAYQWSVDEGPDDFDDV